MVEVKYEVGVAKPTSSRSVNDPMANDGIYDAMANCPEGASFTFKPNPGPNVKPENTAAWAMFRLRQYLKKNLLGSAWTFAKTPDGNIRVWCDRKAPAPAPAAEQPAE